MKKHKNLIKLNNECKDQVEEQGSVIIKKGQDEEQE